MAEKLRYRIQKQFCIRDLNNKINKTGIYLTAKICGLPAGGVVIRVTEEDIVTTEAVDTVQKTVRVISNRKDLESVETDRSIKNVHIAFRPSGKDILLAHKKFPNLQLVQLPKSYRATLADFIESYLTDQNIMLIMGDVWGHRKDLSTYATVKIEKKILDNARDQLDNNV